MSTPAETKPKLPRAHQRQRRLKDAKIVFNGGASVIDCVVRDWSEGGARLKCSQAIALPRHFFLLLRAEWLMYPVELRWRRLEEAGVMFTGPAETPTIKRV
jgi:hypothetical protein